MLDTIVAVATAPGVGGVGIIRVSGAESYRILSGLFGNHKAEFVPRYVEFGSILDTDGQVIDRGCGIFFKGPASFTGEDVAEIHCHGSPYVLRMILESAIALGARLALPGEFSKRAFIYGKIDLTQAESIAELVDVKTELSHSVALSHHHGRLFQIIQDMRRRLMTILEQLEGSLDFPDEVPSVNRQETMVIISEMTTTLQRGLALGDFGDVVNRGVQLAIVGQPNVGKSSVLNRLAGYSRAIVTSIAGTTRDFIDITIELGGLQFTCIDTAGIRDQPADEIELMGIRKIRRLITQSQMVVWVVDGSRPWSATHDAFIRQHRSRKKICILINKSDLKPRLIIPDSYKRIAFFPISAKRNEGLDAFKSFLVHRFQVQCLPSDRVWICNVRQRQCIRMAHQHLKKVAEMLHSRQDDELIAYEIKQVITQLTDLTGESVTEVVLDGVFSRFCVGK